MSHPVGPFIVHVFESYLDDAPISVVELLTRNRAHQYARLYLDEHPWAATHVVLPFPYQTVRWLGSLAADQVGRQNRRRWTRIGSV